MMISDAGIFGLSRLHTVEIELNRRWTQMDADEESRQSPKNQGPNGYPAGSGLAQCFLPVFICVHLRLKGIVPA